MGTKRENPRNDYISRAQLHNALNPRNPQGDGTKLLRLILCFSLVWLDSFQYTVIIYAMVMNSSSN